MGKYERICARVRSGDAVKRFIVCADGCRGGDVANAWTECETLEEAKKSMQWLRELFPERHVYIEATAIPKEWV